MDEAVKYNRYLIDLLLDWATDKQRILDFGAGNGRFGIAMHEAGHEVHAVESDPGLRQKISAGGVIAHAGLASLSGDPFDGIYTINVLEHIDNDEALLANFYGRLLPGGGLLVYVPAFELLFSANDARVGHVRRYRRAGLVEKVERAGFIVDAAQYADCIGFAAAIAYRLLGDRDGGLNLRAVQFYDRILFPISRTFDRIFEGFFGKNLILHAHKPGSEEPRA
jgi:SAM-dependent methyltransferase